MNNIMPPFLKPILIEQKIMELEAELYNLKQEIFYLKQQVNKFETDKKNNYLEKDDNLYMM